MSFREYWRRSWSLPCLGLAFMAMTLPPDRALGAGDGDSCNCALVLPTIAAVQVKASQLLVPTDPHHACTTSIRENSQVKTIWASWLVGVIVGAAILLAGFTGLVAMAMRRMRLESELAKLALREVGATGSAITLLRAHCQVIIDLQAGTKDQLEQTGKADSARALAMACKEFLIKSA